MYIEEPKRTINWGDLIKKGLLVVLVAGIIFLVVWIFTKNNSNAINTDNKNNSNEVLPNQNSYSEIFINNYRYFHDTAKEYFLISELPSNNKEIKYSLQNFIDKKLIVPFGYGDGSCDTEASYVSVKNADGKYTMVVTLLCGTEIAQTKEELGCNQLCQNGTCSAEELLYQYKQAYKTTETTYSCPDGYTKTGSGSNTKCVKNNATTVSAQKVVTYSCENGYTKTGSGSNTKCVKNNTVTKDAKENVTYTCPSGYTQSGTKCVKNDSTSVNAKENVTYTCPSGYTQNGTKCVKNSSTSVDAKENVTYTCPSGYTKDGNKCVKSTSTTVNANSNTTYSCPSGYTKDGDKCVKSTTTYVDAIKNVNVYCPSGYTKDGKSCIKYLYTNISYGPSYEGCTGGQYVTSSCSTGTCVTGKYVYKCTQGVNSVTKYSCKDGSKPNANNKCAETKVEEVDLTSKTTYSCKEGTLSGNKCIITTKDEKTPTKNVTYSCENGYTLSGNKCIKATSATTDATKKVTYSCEAGYTLNGNKCTSETNSSKTSIKLTNYVCEEGYTKNGIGEKATCTKGTTSTIEATKSTKTVTKYKYKWSKETSLSGWEKTGATKVSSK